MNLFKKEIIFNTGKFLAIIIVLLAGILFLRLLSFHIKTVVANYPHEYREGAMALTTQNLIDKTNPFSLEWQPQHTNVYGIFYHLITYPFALIFGSTLSLHRAISGVFIFASCLLILLTLKRQGVPVWLAFTGAVIYYSQLLSLHTIIARPDALGVFLFILALYIPWLKNFNKSSLLISIALSSLAFYTKLYFVASAPIIFLYLFIFKNKRQGIEYILRFLFVITISVLIINHFFDAYFTSTFYYFLAIGNKFTEGLFYAISQLKWFTKVNFALALIFMFATVEFYITNIKNEKQKTKKLYSTIDFKHFQNPLLSYEVDYFFFIFLITSLLFIFKLGHNFGSFADYIHHLISPFLIIIAIRYLSAKRAKNIYYILSTLLIINLYYTITHHKRPVNFTENWRKIEKLLSNHQTIYNDSATTAIMIKQGKYVYDSGHSVAYNPKFEAGLKKAPNYAEIQKRLTSFRKEVDDKVINKKFDMIILNEIREDVISNNLLNKYYYQDSELEAPMMLNNFHLKIWLPKK